jgi:predicted Ser/Thr protein kinase
MGEEQDAQAFKYEVEPVTEQSAAYQTRHERLRERIAKYCLPDQADKVILTVLADIQGYDQSDTYRNVHNTITELASYNLGINP